MPLHRTISIEDLVRQYPSLVGFMIRRGLPCLVCGEPAWGSLEEMARQHGLTDGEISRLVADMERELHTGAAS